MDLNPTVTAAVVAGLISLVVGIISYKSNRSAVRHEVQQAQFKDIITKRIELYPKLWCIHINYETNWVLEGKPKTKEWAQEYVSKLNAFNLEGGLFFSEGLYLKFHELRTALYKAIHSTEAGQSVAEVDIGKIRGVVYCVGGPGLSTCLKDDLGSYRAVMLQRRIDDA